MELLKQIFGTPRQRRINKTIRKSGPQGVEREIGFDEIVWILNYERKDKSQRFIKYEEEQEYLTSVRHFIEAHSLEEHIIVDENKDQEYFKRKISLMKAGHKIIFQNLSFIGSYYKRIDMSEFTFAYIIFRNNRFSYESKKSRTNPDKPKNRLKNYIHLLEYSGIQFENNEFTDVGLNLVERQESELENNDIGYNPNKFVIFKNNIIPFIYPGIRTSIFFKECNIIDRIDIYYKEAENKFDVAWNPHQETNPDGKDSIPNKEFFIALKKVAIEKNDKVQEALISREILRCDNYILKDEPLINSWQDRFIMWFGRVASSHGLSWIRPLSLLMGINLFLTLIIFDIKNLTCNQDFWLIFVEMLNPISNLSSQAESVESLCYGKVLYFLTEEFIIFKGNLAETIKTYSEVIVSAINIVQKIIFAVLIYELIRVGRRFAIK